MNNVDDRIHVRDVDFSIAIHVGSDGIIAASCDDVDDSIDISKIDLAVKVHVTDQTRFRFHLHYLPEIRIPVLVGLIGSGRPLRHMKRAS